MYNVTHITCICRIKLLLHSRIQLIECASEYKRITVFANTYSYAPPCIRDTNRIRHLVYSFQPYWIQCCIKTYIYLFYHQHPVKCYQALAVIWEKMMCNYDQISLHVMQAIFKPLRDTDVSTKLSHIIFIMSKSTS